MQPLTFHNVPDRIRSRPLSDGWSWIILTGLCTLLMYGSAWSLTLPNQSQPMSHATIPWFILVAILMTIATLAAASWTLHSHVIADTQGIRWRSLGRERFARWDQVTDYYDTLQHRGQLTYEVMVIETELGRFTLNRSWSNSAELRTIISANAKRTATQTWMYYGCRPDDNWPHVFDYNGPMNRYQRVSLLALCGLLLVCLLMILIPRVWGNMNSSLSTASAVLGMMMPQLILLYVIGIHANHYFEAWKNRREHQIIARLDGITWNNGHDLIDISWADVRNCYQCSLPGRLQFPGGRYVLETQTQIIEFTRSLENFELLAAIVATYTIASKNRTWTIRDDRESLRPVRPARAGETVYHYQTRSNRAFLWLFASMAFAPILCEIILKLGNIDFGTNIVGLRVLSGLMTCHFLWTWWRYRDATITTNKDGIAQKTAFGTRFIAWSGIQNYVRHGGDTARAMSYADVIGLDTRIRFWSHISDPDALEQEIVRRFPQVNSSNHNLPE